MTDRDQQLRLLRHLSMEKRAWYGAASGRQAPQLPQVNAPEPSEAPAVGRPAMGGTLAAQASNKAAESATLIQQNLAEKMQPLKQVGEPTRPASQPTSRNRNDRMARQVTQPDAGKTSVAHVVPPHGIDKTAQGRFWNAATRVAEDAQKALGSPMQALSEGMYEIPGIGQSLRKADAWMGRNVGRDPGTFLSQEVIQPGAQAVAKGLTTKIPGVNASVAEGMEAFGQGMMGMPVTTPIGMGLRAGGAELQAAGRAARAIPSAARAAGRAALQYGDDLAAKALPSMGPEFAYAGAGGRAAGVAESRLASTAAKRPPGTFMSQLPEEFEPFRGRQSAPTPSVVPPPSAGARATTAPVVETAETAAQTVAKPRLTGGGNRFPPAPEGKQPGFFDRFFGGGEKPKPFGPKPPPGFQPIAEDAAGMARQIRVTDPTGRGAGYLSNDPAAMRQVLENMDFTRISPAGRLVRRVSAAIARPFNQIPTRGIGQQGTALSTEAGVLPAITRGIYNFVRGTPVAGPQFLGGAGLLRSSTTGRITPGAVLGGAVQGAGAASLLYGGYQGAKPYAAAVRKVVGGAPVGQAAREINDPRAVESRLAQEELSKMTPEQLDAYIASLPGGVTSASR